MQAHTTAEHTQACAHSKAAVWQPAYPKGVLPNQILQYRQNREVRWALEGRGEMHRVGNSCRVPLAAQPGAFCKAGVCTVRLLVPTALTLPPLAPGSVVTLARDVAQLREVGLPCCLAGTGPGGAAETPA